jgi:hypothetical protein
MAISIICHVLLNLPCETFMANKGILRCRKAVGNSSTLYYSKQNNTHKKI